MARHRFRFRYAALIADAQRRGFLLAKSEHAESAQAFFEASRDAGLPVVIVAIPRTSAAIEFCPVPGRKLSVPAQERIRDDATTAMTGSVARRCAITVDADGGVIRGVHRDRASVFAAQIADVLRDESSYRDGKVLVFPGGSRTGGAA